jgi:hypothetical protein
VEVMGVVVVVVEPTAPNRDGIGSKCSISKVFVVVGVVSVPVVVVGGCSTLDAASARVCRVDVRGVKLGWLRVEDVRDCVRTLG